VLIGWDLDGTISTSADLGLVFSVESPKYCGNLEACVGCEVMELESATVAALARPFWCNIVVIKDLGELRLAPESSLWKNDLSSRFTSLLSWVETSQSEESSALMTSP
jgi:hypothetical protein